MIKSRTSCAGHVVNNGETRNAYKILTAKPEGKKQLARPRSRREDNIKTYLMKIGGRI
jgi:hypothetical protein